jgi:hypothetical protein
MTIENVNWMNTETMLLEIAILLPSVSSACARVFQAHVGMHKLHLRIP